MESSMRHELQAVLSASQWILAAVLFHGRIDTDINRIDLLHCDDAGHQFILTYFWALHRYLDRLRPWALHGLERSTAVQRRMTVARRAENAAQTVARSIRFEYGHRNKHNRKMIDEPSVESERAEDKKGEPLTNDKVLSIRDNAACIMMTQIDAEKLAESRGYDDLDPENCWPGARVAAGPFLAAHLKTFSDYPPRQGADSLSMKKVIEEAMKKMENPGGGNN